MILMQMSLGTPPKHDSVMNEDVSKLCFKQYDLDTKQEWKKERVAL
jgi:hypothetical protein